MPDRKDKQIKEARVAIALLRVDLEDATAIPERRKLVEAIESKTQELEKLRSTSGRTGKNKWFGKLLMKRGFI